MPVPVSFVASLVATLLAVLYGMLLFLKHCPRLETDSETKYKTNDGQGNIHNLPPRLSCKKKRDPEVNGLELSVVCLVTMKRHG